MIFIERVGLRNYKSIAQCDVPLTALTYLVGPNGSGKSNFLDALHLVKDALSGSLDNAIQNRGGLTEVRRRSGGHPTHFGIRLEFRLRDGQRGRYSFNIGALKRGGFEVQMEECLLGERGKGPYYKVEKGVVIESSEATFPAVVPDRLALVNAAGNPVFRPIFDALTSMGFYNLNPKLIRELQRPQDGRLLQPAGENIVSVIAHLERDAGDAMAIIQEYLQKVVPMIHGIERKVVGPAETLEFRQEVAGQKHPWRFLAQNMSDGTLRALGILTALYQQNQDHTPSLIGIEEPETALHPAATSALRDALQRASERTQVLVTSHSPDLLDDNSIGSEQILSVNVQEGETQLAPVDQASREAMHDHLFTPGELLRINQLAPDPAELDRQKQSQLDLFADRMS
jgi:predicted ATPase